MKKFKRCVVRVQSETYKRGDSYFIGKSIRVIKRHTEFDILYEEVNNIGISDALENISNLDSVGSGLYELVPHNISYDCETGYVDDMELILTPYKEY